MIETLTAPARPRTPKLLDATILAIALIISNSVGHVLRTSENSAVGNFAKATDCFALYGGAEIIPQLNNSCVSNPTPLDLAIDELMT